MNNDKISTDDARNPILDFVEEFGIDMLSQEEQEEFLGDVADALFESVLLRAALALSEQDRDALTTLIERASTDDNNDAHQEAVFSFLKLKVPNLDGIVRDEVMHLKSQYDAIKKEVAEAKA